MKRTLILAALVAALAYSFAYHRLVVSDMKRVLHFQTLISEKPGKTTAIPLELKKQRYWLVVKHEKTGPSAGPAVSINGKTPSCRTSGKRAVLATKCLLDPAILRNGTNRLEVSFPGEPPRDLDIRIGNFRKKLSEDMAVIFKENVSLRHPRLGQVFLLFALIQLAGIALISRIAPKDRLRSFLYVNLLPASFMLILAIVPAAAGYRVLITRFLFILFLAGLAAPAAVLLILKSWRTNSAMNRLAFNLAAFGVSLILLLGAGELIARVYARRFHYNGIFSCDTDMELLYRLKPDSSGTFAGKEVHCNNLGLRGRRDIPLAKPAGITRILCAGDSITFGLGVNDDEPYPVVLGTLLGANHETINGGIPAYNTYQERLFFERYSSRLDPDIVIVGICLNDIVAAGVSFPLSVSINMNGPIYTGPWERLYRFKAMPFSSKAQLRLYRHSYLAQYILMKSGLILSRFNRFKRPMTGDYSNESLAFYRGEDSAGIKRQQAIFEEEMLLFKASVEATGARLILVLFPNDIQLTDTALRAPQRAVAAFCAKNKIELLDLTPVFERYDRKQLLVDIGHPGPFGHTLAAQAIADYLNAQKN